MLPELTKVQPRRRRHAARLAHLVGPGAALGVILEARALTPDEALEIGLVNRVVSPKGDLLAEAIATAERMARRAPVSVAAAKRTVREGSTFPLPAGLAIERKWFLACGSKPHHSHRAMPRRMSTRSSARAPPWRTRRRSSRGARARWST